MLLVFFVDVERIDEMCRINFSLSGLFRNMQKYPRIMLIHVPLADIYLKSSHSVTSRDINFDFLYRAIIKQTNRGQSRTEREEEIKWISFKVHYILSIHCDCLVRDRRVIHSINNNNAQSSFGLFFTFIWWLFTWSLVLNTHTNTHREWQTLHFLQETSYLLFDPKPTAWILIAWFVFFSLCVCLVAVLLWQSNNRSFGNFPGSNIHLKDIYIYIEYRANYTWSNSVFLLTWTRAILSINDDNIKSQCANDYTHLSTYHWNC